MNHSIQNRENDYYIYSWGQGWSDQGLNEYSIDRVSFASNTKKAC